MFSHYFARPLKSDVAPIVAAIAVAWLIALATAITGSDPDLLQHVPREDHHPSTVGGIFLALAAWQVMTGAMMLPSSVPMFHLFARASSGQERPALARIAFLAGYLAVWTWFALMALTANALVHWLAAYTGWLLDRPWLAAGTVLVLAGAFQFSSLKERCLRECRTPFTFLQRHYRRGLLPAWDLGLQHGLFCLGCCWALMVTMFVVGIGSLIWMAALTGVMVIEKTLPWGRRLTPAVGALLTTWGILVIAHPSWLPGPLGGG